VPPEIAKLKGTPLLVLYGADDKASCGASLSRELGDIRSLPGGHHFDHNYQQLIQSVLDALNKQSPERAGPR